MPLEVGGVCSSGPTRAFCSRFWACNFFRASTAASILSLATWRSCWRYFLRLSVSRLVRLVRLIIQDHRFDFSVWFVFSIPQGSAYLLPSPYDVGSVSWYVNVVCDKTFSRQYSLRVHCKSHINGRAKTGDANSSGANFRGANSEGAKSGGASPRGTTLRKALNKGVNDSVIQPRGEASGPLSGPDIRVRYYPEGEPPWRGSQVIKQASEACFEKEKRNVLFLKN